MTIAAFILGLIGTITGGLALWIQWRTYQRDSEKHEREIRREQQASEPFFKWFGGRTNHASAINRLDASREFSNEGGAVAGLEIKAHGDMQAVITPKDHLGMRGKGKIELLIPGVSVLSDVTFEISYVTHLNVRSRQVFKWSAFNDGPHQVTD